MEEGADMQKFILVQEPDFYIEMTRQFILWCFWYKHSEISIHLTLIFTSTERNVDQDVLKVLISENCLDFTYKMSGN